MGGRAFLLQNASDGTKHGTRNLKVVTKSSQKAHSNEYHIARVFPPFYFIIKWDVLLRLQHVADRSGNGNAEIARPSSDLSGLPVCVNLS